MSLPAHQSRPQQIVPVSRRHDAPAADRLAEAILGLVGEVPATAETPDASTEARSAAVVASASRRAAMVAGSLALPPGPLGWLTVIPELIAIWRIQAQMVADLAGVHGQHWRLGREQMLFCLFRHTSAQAFRDFAVRAGERWLIQQATQATLQNAARLVGVKLSKRAVGRGAARWLPVIGAVGVGAYAWYDTRQVARTAIALFAGADTDERRD